MRSKLHAIFLTSIFATALLPFIGCSGDRNSGPASDPKPSTISLTEEQRTKIRIQPVQISSFRRAVETTGTVAFNNDRSTQVIAPISGPVSRLLVTVGDKVQKGQALATIASPDFASAISNYRKTAAAATTARSVADLNKKLFDNGGISKREMQQSETDAISAEADRDAAIEQLRSLGVQDKTIDDIHQGHDIGSQQASIRAPLTGTVVERLITPGQLTQAGTTPCFTIADMSSVWVMANIFESDLQFVETGEAAEINTPASSQTLSGKVDYIAAEVDPNTRAISVRILTPNPKEILKKDMYVRVTIRARNESSSILVPVSAILRDDENLPFVFVQNSDGSFGRRRVEIGMRSGDQQEITGGLKVGEQIVGEGGLFMQFAQSQ